VTQQLELLDASKLSKPEASRLKGLEASIKKGMKSFVAVGAALLAVRDARLYRQKYATFEEYCQKRWGMTPQHAGRLISGAKATANLEPIGSKFLPENEAQVRPISDLPPAAQRAVWQEVTDQTDEAAEKITALRVQSVRERMFPPGQEIPEEYFLEPEASTEATETKPHVSSNSGNNHWYTPAVYIEAARSCMGTIDIDPASSEMANQTVKATKFFTAEQNGLEQSWSAGSCWLNPPYSADLIGKFAEAVSSKYESGEIQTACILVNNATDTAWFQRMMGVASAICFLSRRVKFIDMEGKPSGAPLQGQAVLYMGENPDKFMSCFDTLGAVWIPWQ